MRYGYLHYASLRYAFFRDAHLQNRLVPIQLGIDAFMIWTILFQIEKLNILSKSRNKIDLILVVYLLFFGWPNQTFSGTIVPALVSAFLKIFSFSTCNYADQIKPLIQRTPTGRLCTVACFKILELFQILIIEFCVRIKSES